MKTITLYYRNAAENADKVYTVWLEQVAGGFNVNVTFGKRGTKYVTHCKSSCPTLLDLAEKLFDKIVKSKLADGYTESPDGQPFGGDAVKLAEVLPHPNKQIVNLAAMRNFSAQDYLKLRKYDGELAKIKIGGATILAEFMRTEISGHFYTAGDREMFKRWPGGWWAALTVMEVHGENVLTRSTRERWGILCSFAGQFTPDIILAETVTDVEACMASGAEGIVAMDWTQPWGTMFAHKVESIYLCRVNRIGGTQSVGIEDAETKQDRGRVKLGGGKCDQVRVGSIIRVEAMGETDSGKLRQPVPCREWLLQF